MSRITPFLWFDNNLEDAMTFYQSVFKQATIHNVMRQGPDGPVFTATFELEGQRFHGLNGGPMYQFTPAVSFFISCENQAEVDYYWSALTAGGSEQPCGWLVDRFGLSWQVVPAALMRFLSDKDPAKSGRAMQAMLTMRKLDIRQLQAAFDGP